MTLTLLSAGAARGLVAALGADFTAGTGAGIEAAFGAVGAMKDRLASGEPCDLVILTAAMIDALLDDGQVEARSVASLGRVRTGIAVRAGDTLPDLRDGAALRAALLASTGILFPDPLKATAGVHFVAVLDRLGIRDVVAARLRPYPHGAAAMQELAQSREPGLIGCTQITEIRYTPGVALAGALPPEFVLATVYSAAVCANARQPELGRRFASLLTGPASLALRRQGGFEA